MEDIFEDVYFKWYDFVLFVVVLIASSLIGLFFGITGRRKRTINDYLMGGKSLGVVPIACSLTSSVISSVSMMAVPSDNYRFGISLLLMMVTIQLSLLFVYFGILPVYCNLQLVSIFEYIELRFNSSLRKVCSLMYTILMISYLPVVVFVPSIALAQGTGFDMQYVALVVSIVCAIYTAIGGIKTVVWTDAFQFAVMIATTTSVAFIGVQKSGGFGKILADSKAGGRLDIDFSFDPTRTYTFWTIFVGHGIYWVQYIGANQACIQKCLALSSRKDIKWSLILFGVCVGLLTLTTNIIGLNLYSTFKDCDPYTAKQIQHHDQLLPFYILHVLGDFPGLSGLFIAGIFSGGLSSLSAGMNALSCTIYNDFMKSFLDQNTSEEKKSFILKLLVALLGIVVTLLVLVVGKFGTIMAVTMSFGGLLAGPVFGVFLLGLFSKRANPKAAFCGIAGSLAILSWIFIGQQFYTFNNLAKSQSQPVSVEGCPQHLNATTMIRQNHSDQKTFFLYEISYFYFTFIGTFMVILIGLPVAFLNKGPEVPDKYLSPLRVWKKKHNEYIPVKIEKTQEETL